MLLYKFYYTFIYKDIATTLPGKMPHGSLTFIEIKYWSIYNQLY